MEGSFADALFGNRYQEESTAAADDPQPGDYWHDMFCPVCAIVDVRDNSLILCRKVKEVSNDKWAWDLSELTWMPRSEFKKWLSYGNIPGYWAHVFPKSHAWVIEALGE